MKTLSQEQALEIAQTICGKLENLSVVAEGLTPIICQAYCFNRYVRGRLNENHDVFIGFDDRRNEFSVSVRDKRNWVICEFDLPFDKVSETSEGNIFSTQRILLENGPFKALKLKKMGELFRKLEKTATPSEAYDLVLNFIGDDIETSTSFRYGDFKISYELSVIDEVTNFKLKVEDRSSREMMLDLSLRLNRNNIKNIYASVSKMVEMFK